MRIRTGFSKLATLLSEARISVGVGRYSTVEALKCLVKILFPYSFDISLTMMNDYQTSVQASPVCSLTISLILYRLPNFHSKLKLFFDQAFCMRTVLNFDP